MKKNKMMRIASVLLVAALISTCAISGTFAKYVTSGEAADTARVAKFGVTVTGSSDLFAKSYAADDESYTLSANSVVSSNDDKVVAPGTTGELTNFDIKGQPEVAVRVSYTVDSIDLGNNWIAKEDTSLFYCPLWITIDDGTTSVTLCGLDYASAEDFEAAIKGNVEAISHDYKPNTKLHTATANDNLVISWKWYFEDPGFTGLAGLAQTDERDTFLGDRAAGNIGNAGTIALTVTCTVTQID